MADPVVLYEVKDGIATVTLNRPERLNAATVELGQELHARLKQADADAEVRCVILTGAGRAFCAGDDIQDAWREDVVDQEVGQGLASMRPNLTGHVEQMLNFGKPLIAAIKGPAVGIGMDLALLCDIRIAAESAKLGQFYVKMGLMPDVTGLWRLPQLIGLSRAAELILSARTVDAQEAERIGLVSHVVPDDELAPAARKLAEQIAANPPLSLQYAKEGLRRGHGRTLSELPELGHFVGHGLATLFKTEDHKEAAAAFFEKRRPVFKGK